MKIETNDVVVGSGKWILFLLFCGENTLTFYSVLWVCFLLLIWGKVLSGYVWKFKVCDLVNDEDVARERNWTKNRIVLCQLLIFMNLGKIFLLGFFARENMKSSRNFYNRIASFFTLFSFQ